MTCPEPLPAPLEVVGRQLTAAAHRRGPVRAHTRRRWARSLLAVPAAVVAAAAAAAIVLITSAGPATTPAYALTRHANGSITITLSELTTGIPALNAKLKALGIDETVIPIKAGCDSPDGSGHVVMRPDPAYEYDGSISTTYTPRAAQRHPAAPGFHYVLAAKRLPNGKILGFIGALKTPVPTCLPYNSKPSTSLSTLSRPAAR